MVTIVYIIATLTQLFPALVSLALKNLSFLPLYLKQLLNLKKELNSLFFKKTLVFGILINNEFVCNMAAPNLSGQHKVLQLKQHPKLGLGLNAIASY